MPGQFPVDVAIACAAEGVDMLPLCTVPQWIGFLKSANDDSDIADCEIAAEKR